MKSAQPSTRSEESVSVSPGEVLERFKGHSPKLIRGLMQIFLKTAPPAFEKLVAAIQRGDWETARDSAHYLRGGACRMIAPDLQEGLEQIESVCGSESPAVSNSELDALKKAFQGACDSAEMWLAGDRSDCVTS